MSTASTPETPAKKPGFFTKLVDAVGEVVNVPAELLDSVISGAATTVGRLIPGSARAEAEEVLDDVTDGLKADDVATSAAVGPVAAAPAVAPVAAAPTATS